MVSDLRKSLSIHYQLNMNLTPNIRQLVQKYIATLESEGIPVKEAYIFGSFATGKASRDSDVDLAVISPKFGKDRQRERALLLKKRAAEELIIEPHPFSEQEFGKPHYYPLVAEIKKHAIKIFHAGP